MKDELRRIFKSKMFLTTLIGVSILPLIFGNNFVLVMSDTKIVLVFVFISLFFVWELLVEKRK